MRRLSIFVMDLRATLNRVSRDRSGATIVEFAFIAMPLAALLLAIFQVCLTIFAQQTLETAVEKSARVLMTGEAQGSGMTKAQFKTRVCQRVPTFMACSQVLVDVQSASNFSGANTSRPTLTYNGSGGIVDNFVYNPGGRGTINVVRIMYPWSVIAGPFGFNLSNIQGSKRLLVATAVFKTEAKE